MTIKCPKCGAVLKPAYDTVYRYAAAHVERDKPRNCDGSLVLRTKQASVTVEICPRCVAPDALFKLVDDLFFAHICSGCNILV